MYYSLEISLTTIRTYVWSSTICCPQHISPLQILRRTFPLRRSPVADSPYYHCICPCAICHRTCLCADLLLRVCQRICLAQTPSHSCGLANLQSTWVQSSSQDCCLAALRFILVPIIIARLCSRSTLGLRSSHDLPLFLWQVIFGQPAITRLAPNQFALCFLTSPSSPCTLSFVFLHWALPFALEVVMTSDQLTSLESAPFTSPLYSIAFSLTTIRTYVWLFPHLLPSTPIFPSQFPRTALARIFPLQFPRTALARSHLPRTRIYPHVYLPGLSIVAQSSLNPLAIYPWANTLARLRLRSTLGKSSSHDRLLTVWRSTLGQSSSQDCRLAILRTNLGQSAIAPSPPGQSAIYPSSPAPWLFSVHAEHPPPHQLVEYYWVDGFTLELKWYNMLCHPGTLVFDLSWLG